MTKVSKATMPMKVTSHGTWGNIAIGCVETAKELARKNAATEKEGNDTVSKKAFA